MQVGPGRSKPDLARVRAIKEALRAQLQLTDVDTVTVAELACLESSCAPVETVLGLLRPGAPQLQRRLHKATSAVTDEDLAETCRAWRRELESNQSSPSRSPSNRPDQRSTEQP
ncbi:MAG: hypothetical protein FJ293_12240 [Planctomycetes bacterium]|nr:hypothetical protein [Planctomycetota bacterium]